MTTSELLRGCCLGMAGLLLTSCDNGLEIHFTQPFPAQAADIVVFPAQYQAVYTSENSRYSLCIGRTAMWQQELRQRLLSQRQADSMAHLHVRSDTTYKRDGQLYHVQVLGRDSVRNSWLWTDTVFTLTGAGAGKLRRFQGRYYLNTPDETGDKWAVQRLEMHGSRLNWQVLGKDTLRLLTLDPATVRYHREKGALTSIQLTPAPGAQTRRVGRHVGLWESKGEYKRQN